MMNHYIRADSSKDYEVKSEELEWVIKSPNKEICDCDDGKYRIRIVYKVYTKFDTFYL